MLGNFNTKLGGEGIFKPTIWNESLHQDCDDNVVRIVNFASSKNLVVKSTVFPLYILNLRKLNELEVRKQYQI
jgi:hypothetical protein